MFDSSTAGLRPTARRASKRNPGANSRRMILHFVVAVALGAATFASSQGLVEISGGQRIVSPDHFGPALSGTYYNPKMFLMGNEMGAAPLRQRVLPLSSITCTSWQGLTAAIGAWKFPARGSMVLLSPAV